MHIHCCCSVPYKALEVAVGMLILQIGSRPLELADMEKIGKIQRYVAKFHVHNTNSFKYLGSHLVNSTLSDEPEIRHRIEQALA